MKKIIFYLLITLTSFPLIYTFVPAQDKIRIAVVPKNNASLFWKSIHAGVKFGAMATRVEIIWKAPQIAGNKEQQIEIVDQFVSEGVSGIVLAPINFNELVEPVLKATKNEIPVLIFDSAIKGTPGKDFVSFVGIDNRKAGRLAGDHLANLLKGKGNVIILRNLEGEANTTEREEGFIEAISKHRGIRIIEKDRYAGGSSEKAKNVSMGLISKLRNADGVFCPNESSTMGMLLALRNAELVDKIKFIGFDTPSPFIEALEKGEIDALIIQNPSLIGFQSVKTLADRIRGKNVPPTIDTGVHLITRKDLNDEDVKKLLALPSFVEDGL